MPQLGLVKPVIKVILVLKFPYSWFLEHLEHSQANGYLEVEGLPVAGFGWDQGRFEDLPDEHRGCGFVLLVTAPLAALTRRRIAR